MAIILASTATALLLVAAAILIHEFFSFRAAAVEDLKTQAEIIGNDSSAVPMLGDSSVAEKKLNALSAKPDIVAACLYRAVGPRDLYKTFATYHTSDVAQFDFPKVPLAGGWTFSNGNLDLYYYFNSGDTPGAIFLESDLRGLHERLWHYALLIGIFTLTSLVVTFMLASRLLRVISQPIYHLSQTARVVSTQKNYAVRAIKESNDELGNLIEGFNEMLSQIQERDVALHRVNEDLEQRVRERTRDLEQQFARISLINQITQGVAARQDFESIVSIVLQQLEDHLPVDYGSSYMFDARADALNVLVRGPKSQPIAEALKMPDSVAMDLTPFRTCKDGEMVYLADLRKEDMPLAGKILGLGFNSIIGTPLVVQGKMFGLLVLMRREADAFSRAERDFIHGLSAHVALAIHQAQLYQDLQNAYNDLRQSQQAAMQQERLKALGQMASGVAHDINNALSPVVGFSDLIARNEKNITDATRKHLQYIKTAGEDIAHIVKRLREFYRPRDQHESLQSLKLGFISKEVVEMMQPRWRDIPQVNGINIEMHTEFDPATPEFAGIESEVREALTNLILNAVDALPHGGTITVRTCGVQRPVKNGESANYAILEVCDTGVGMDEPTQKRCLEPFFSTKGKRGTGLGLAMVYGVVERHEGKIEIESEPGKGTTMRILFAIRKLAVPDATEFFENEQPPPPLRILCIDDEPALRMLICEILEHDGHKVEAADGGQAGVNAFQAALMRKDPFDAVITDLGMPFVDGMAVARAVKSQSATPVIMLTGWGAFLKGDGDIPKEVDGVLSKPPRIQEMRATLRRVTTHK